VGITADSREVPRRKELGQDDDDNDDDDNNNNNMCSNTF
jgi:hypothetical protein